MMDPLETLIQASRPGPLPSGPHRYRLARLLRERQGSARPESWTTLRYAIALAAGALCLILAIVTQPRTPAPQYFAEERQLLTSVLPAASIAAQGFSPVVLPAPRMTEVKTTPPHPPGQMLRENRESLDQMLDEERLRRY